MTDLYKTRRISAKPLVFRNAFRTTGYVPPAVKTRANTISFFTGNPNTTTSVEERDKARNAIRAMERQNAGILDKKGQVLKALKKIQDRNTKKKLEKNLIQYLATADLEDGVPNYIPNKYRKEAIALRNKMRRMAIQKYTKIHQPGWFGRQSLVKNLAAKKEREEFIKENPELETYMLALYKQAKKEKKDRNLADDVGPDLPGHPEVPSAAEHPYDYEKDVYGNPIDEAKVLGGSGVFIPTRTKHLFQRLKKMPFYRKEQTPEEQVKEQQSEHEQRQEKYKEEQKEARGAPPPRDMVDRAMPESAEPVKYVTGISSIVMAPLKLKKKSKWY